MRTIKRKLALLLALVGLLTLCASASLAEVQANITDNVGPTITDIQVKNTSSPFEWSAKIIDDSGVYYDGNDDDDSNRFKPRMVITGTASDASDDFYVYSITGAYDKDTNRFNFTIDANSSKFVAGTYNVATFSACDIYGNITVESPSEAQAKIDITLTGASETSAPSIMSFSLNQDGNSVTCDDELKFEAKISVASEHELEQVSIYAYDENGSYYDSYDMDYNQADNKYTLSIWLHNDVEGTYVFELYARDNYGLTLTNYAEYVRSVKLIKEAEYIYAPEISEIWLQNPWSQRQDGETITITAEVVPVGEDNRIEKGSVYAYFANTFGDQTFTVRLDQKEGNTYSRTYSLDKEQFVDNVYHLVSVSATDVYGNTATANPDEPLWFTFLDETVYPTSISIESNVELNTSTSIPEPSYDLDSSLVILPENVTDPRIIWTSSNESIVSVDDDGIITAHATGTAYIRATSYANGVTGECRVVVNGGDLVKSITIDNAGPISLTCTQVDPNPTVTLTATVLPTTAKNKVVNWVSSDPTVAKVDAKGVVTALKEGKANIHAEATDGSGVCSDYITVNVTSSVVATDVIIDETSITLDITASDPYPVYQLVATVYPTAACDDVDWYSSDTDVAVVSEYGVVTAISEGVCYITARSADPLASATAFDSCKVVVEEGGVEDVYFTKNQVTLRITTRVPHPTKNLRSLLKVVSSTSCYKLRWTSSDRSIATVKNGVVTAKGLGTCTITAIVRGTGLRASIKVRVK